MKNIIWQKSDGSYAVTTLADLLDISSADYAAYLKSINAVQSDWTLYKVDQSDISMYITPSAAEIKAVLIYNAQLALTASDIIVLRCYENSVAVPSDWVSYRNTLRNIISTGSGTIPIQPTNPAGI